jgi:hypothetical protein
LGQQFVNDDDIIMVVTTGLQAPDQDFFVKGFNASWVKCLNRGDNYLKK